MNPEPDICATRHGNDAESLAAHATVDAVTDRNLILSMITIRGTQGLTLDEASILTGRPPNQISGRFSELRMKGAIRATEQRRKTRSGTNAKVYQAI
jgi:predicted transcriptional regulator